MDWGIGEPLSIIGVSASNLSQGKERVCALRLATFLPGAGDHCSRCHAACQPHTCNLDSSDGRHNTDKGEAEQLEKRI